MKYTEKLLCDPFYISRMKEIEAWETDRIYCHHEMEHALDVCRIAWIMYLEAHAGECLDTDLLEQKKDHFYVTGLLHDLGRTAQYEGKENHAVAGSRWAGEILAGMGYPEDLKKETEEAIALHPGRDFTAPAQDTLAYYIYAADHISRNCFCCKAADSCKWTDEERNRTITY